MNGKTLLIVAIVAVLFFLVACGSAGECKARQEKKKAEKALWSVKEEQKEAPNPRKAQTNAPPR